MKELYRPAHCLRSEKGLIFPRRYLFFDTETRQTKDGLGGTVHTLRLGWACYYCKAYNRHLAKEEWKEFRTPGEFWVFLFAHTESKQRLWVFARNLAFDFTMVQGWDWLKSKGYKLKFFHSSGTNTLFIVRDKGISVAFIDVLNFFRESLEETGKRLGIPKLRIDFETATEDYLSIYCKRDVEIELENIKQFIKFLAGNNLCSLSYTIGSTAFKAFLHRFYINKIYIHNNKTASELERKSYRGGRVECFKMGLLPYDSYYVVDVNSLYPYVMKRNLYPVKYLQFCPTVTIAELEYILKRYAVIANVYIDTKEPVYAVRRKFTIFPVGKFWVTLTTPELQFAFEHNHILRLGETVIYHKADIFSKYVDYLYRLRIDFRQAGVILYENMCKLLLNSLYGKFGQRCPNWKVIGKAPNEIDRVEFVIDHDTKQVTLIRYLMGEVSLLKGHSETFNSFPAISSHVTAYGRLYLWRLMCMVGQGNYFYCDTDSLIVNSLGLERLEAFMDNTELGKLKIAETSNYVEIRGAKDYTLASGDTIKGISHKAIKLGDNTYQQEIWPSFKGLFHSGKVNRYTVSTIVKNLSRIYDKGNVAIDGVVRPLVLSESGRVFQSELHSF